jgi:MYXO-CTERM domain-containing protein
MRFLFLSLLSSSLVCLVACTSRDEPKVGSSSQAIIDGTKDTQDLAVVQVLIQHATNPTPETSFQCTGTVVSPHVVVTAAHCLSPDLIGPDQSFYVFYGDDSNDATELADRGNFGYAKSATPHPDFNPNTIATTDAVNGDLGVIVLRDKAPVTPIALQHEPPAVGASLHVVGYGMRAPRDADTSGLRTDTTATLGAVAARSMSFDGATHSVCEGDSGGPSLLDGKLAGIHSFIEHSKSCSGLNYDVRVDAYAPWIETTIRKADPGFLPAEPADAGADADTSSPPDDAGASAEAAPSSSSSCAASPRPSAPWTALLAAAMVGLAVARRRRATYV